MPAQAAPRATPAVTERTAHGPERSSTASTTVCVHVVGAVAHPGVYVLKGGSRGIDAVGAAGGLTRDASQDGVNLAARLEDGEQLVVPLKGADGAAGRPGGSTSARSPGGAAAGKAQAVDINAADAAALDALPGVGPSTAAKIVADREANGRFATVDDLGRVPGIGPKKLEQLRDLVRVR